MILWRWEGRPRVPAAAGRWANRYHVRSAAASPYRSIPAPPCPTVRPALTAPTRPQGCVPCRAGAGARPNWARGRSGWRCRRSSALCPPMRAWPGTCAACNGSTMWARSCSGTTGARPGRNVWNWTPASAPCSNAWPGSPRWPRRPSPGAWPTRWTGSACWCCMAWTMPATCWCWWVRCCSTACAWCVRHAVPPGAMCRATSTAWAPRRCPLRRWWAFSSAWCWPI